VHTCANKSSRDCQGKSLHSHALYLSLIRHCIHRVYCGSATRLFDGVNHHRSSTACSPRSFKDSSNMMRQDGQRRLRHSPQSYGNVWPFGIMSRIIGQSELPISLVSHHLSSLGLHPLNEVIFPFALSSMPFDNMVQFSIPVSALLCFVVLSLSFVFFCIRHEFSSRCISRHLLLYPSLILDLIFQ